MPLDQDTPPARSASIAARTPVVAVVGATGAVGVELIASLESRGFPLSSLRLLASPRSAGRTFEPRVLAQPYAFNLFSHDATVDPLTGDNGEETKVVMELRKILSTPDLRVGITCVRVPVLRAHTIAMTVEFDRPLSPDSAREILGAAPGIRIIDDRAANRFPMPRDATGQDDVLVGRLREDGSDPSGRSLSMLVAGDQLLKGAALNAVQIAEMLLG